MDYCIESQYINISTYRPLAGRSYIDLPIELKNPRKGLINIKNNDQKCFLWCHLRHINPVKEYPGRILKIDRKIACNLNYDGVKFHVGEKDFSKIEVQNNICLMCLVMKINWFFQFLFLIKHLKVQ